MSKKSSGGKSDILSRLTDTSKYTGAHKQRFDSTGKGKGLAGRDMGNESRVTDISQVMRTNLRQGGTVPKVPHTIRKTSGSVSGTSSTGGKRASSPGASKRSASPGAASPSNKRASSPGPAGGKKTAGSIVSRLTDVTKYTGAHKQRFDSSGKGRGKAGREDSSKVNDLSQLTRSNLHKSATGPPKHTKAGTVSGVSPMHVQKFGTQAATAKKIRVFQNGDKNHAGVMITLTRAINTYGKLLDAVTSKVPLPTGACKSLYLVTGPGTFSKVHAKHDLEEIQDGANYLACGPEEIIHDRLPQSLAAAAPAATPTATAAPPAAATAAA